MLNVGACLYTCNAIKGDFPLPCHSSQLNDYICEDLHRTGRLCGTCIKGYAPPVYSYDLRCVECKNYHYNWLKYLAAAFLPLTLFFLIVMTFSISFTTPRISYVVLVYQLMANPTQLSVIVSLSNSGLLLLHKNTVNIIASMIAVWNLDFFRVAYKPFCLHPKMTTLHTLVLDYAIAAYPLFLIVFTYVMVTLHDRGFKPVKCIWGPIMRLSRKLKQHCGTKTSLIDVFASFIFLSSSRLLSASFVLLVPNTSYSLNINYTSPHVNLMYYVYMAPNIRYLSKEHLPVAMTAFLVVLLLNFLPMMLLFVYPFKCFQHLLNKLNLNSNSLRIFVEVFQGSYKDGTNGTRDYRCFSGFPLFLEVVLSLLFWLTRSTFHYPIGSICILIYCCLIASFQPYKKKQDNIITVIMMAAFRSAYVGITISIILSRRMHPLLQNSYPEIDVLFYISTLLIGTGVATPSLYLLGLGAFLVHTRLVK